MDTNDYTTESVRRKGKHLTATDRGEIKAMHKMGKSNREIAAALNCSPTTVSNELKRGTPPRKSDRGRAPEYSPEYGQKQYEENRKRCRRPPVVIYHIDFVAWVINQFRNFHWSLDACVGYAKAHNTFAPEEMTCTKTLYNAIWKGLIELTPTDLPKALKRKIIKAKAADGTKKAKDYGKSIDERPEIAGQGTEFGHWEGDTVVGTRDGKGHVVLTLCEKVTRKYIAILLPEKSTKCVMDAISMLRDFFGDAYFSKVFKTITVDNGPEFSNFSEIETWGADQEFRTGIYFAHPYKSTDRAQNEHANGMFRYFFPKGKSMNDRTMEEAIEAADMMNGMPRRSLNYGTSDELFEAFLDAIYSTLEEEAG